MRLHLGFDSLIPGNGGICRVARLIARVAAEEVAAGRLERATACVLRDTAPPSNMGIPVQACGGSRLQFVARCSRAKFTATHAIYDFVGLAAAHTILPFPRRPFLAYIHGIEVWKGWARPKYAQSADRAAVLVSNSVYTRERASQWHPALARAIVCWLGTEEDEAPVLSRGGRGPPRVLILGRLNEDRYKGHDELLACWQAVREAVPDAILTIAGTGPALLRFEKMAGALPAGSVEVRGFVPEADMPRLWAETTVFAMPSRGEGFGLVYIEAMRQGLPVIASVHDAASEVVADGQTGYVVNLDRPGELPDRIIALLIDPERARAMGLAGQRRWAEHFRYSAFRDRFRPLLQEFLSR